MSCFDGFNRQIGGKNAGLPDFLSHEPLLESRLAVNKVVKPV